MILYIFANLTKNQNSIPSKNGNGMLEISFIAIFESIPVSVLRSKYSQERFRDVSDLWFEGQLLLRKEDWFEQEILVG